jgi:hypothetical protein
LRQTVARRKSEWVCLRIPAAAAYDAKRRPPGWSRAQIDALPGTKSIKPSGGFKCSSPTCSSKTFSTRGNANRCKHTIPRSSAAAKAATAAKKAAVRAATAAKKAKKGITENNQNKSLYKTNTSGKAGVRLCTNIKKKPWRARFYINKKQVTHYFATEEEAIACREAMEKRHYIQD